ncbi:Na+-dependent transporter [Novosphingobium panipatense]|jgi:BASS family bile acid:Na+ symporter|uniref:Na+-dependent transporter n=1 Tax=Novosphingobium TaxID=165696 RepID=UPI000CDB249F|nr:Na+-dependent transporter [Novosphingobium sp. HII-3]
MEIAKTIIPLLLTVSLGLLVIAAGIASSRGDFAYVISRPRLLAKALVAVMIVPTIVALIVILIFPMSHSAKAGIFLMAISPVPPLMPGRALKFGGSAGYVYGLQGAGAVLALVMVPLLGLVGASIYGVDAHFPVSVVARNIFIGLVVPLAIGLIVGRWVLPGVSPSVPRTITLIANVLLVLAFIPLLVAETPAIMALIGNGTVVAMAAVVVAGLLGGHILGGPELRDRSTLAFTAAIRHPGIALALAGANHAAKPVTAAVLLFLLVGLLVLVPYQMFLNRRLKRLPVGTQG